MRNRIVSRAAAWIFRDTPGFTGLYMRRWLIPGLFEHCGGELHCLQGVRITRPERLALGDSVRLGVEVYLACDAGVELEDYVMVGPGAVILSTVGKPRRAADLAAQFTRQARVRIGAGTWLGAAACVMPGVTIERESVVMACSVVFPHEYPAGAILGGNPARVIGRRDFTAM